MAGKQLAEHEGRNWVVALVSFAFIIMQSACTMVMTISGIRLLLGLGALLAAYGLHVPSTGFHANIIRVPMMLIAVGGSVLNLYVIWRIRSLRERPASQWRVKPATQQQRRAETFQTALSLVTLLLVVAEEATHLIIHGS